jgi:cation transport regulator ChaB
VSGAGQLDPAALIQEIGPLYRRRQRRAEEPMPYERDDDLPEAVRQLPKAQREKWRAVFNSAWHTYAGSKDRERKAFATAWAAVRNHRDREEKEREPGHG